VLSFNYLIREYYEEIIPWLAQDAMTFDHRKRIKWDYFGPTTRAKKMVWSSDEVIRFASSNRFDFAHAMQFVRKNFKVENVEIALHVKIKSSSGFQIQIEHSKE